MTKRLTPQSSRNKLNVSIRVCLLFMCRSSRHCPINFLCLRNGNIFGTCSYDRVCVRVTNANPSDTNAIYSPDCFFWFFFSDRDIFTKHSKTSRTTEQIHRIGLPLLTLLKPYRIASLCLESHRIGHYITWWLSLSVCCTDNFAETKVIHSHSAP